MKTLVVGVGSEIRGDDGVGPQLIHLLSERPLPTDVDLLTIGTGGLALLDLISGYERVIIVDAIVSGAKPGTIIALDDANIGKAVHLSTGHDADLPTVLALGERLLKKKMPSSVVILAVEADSLHLFSEALSDKVAAALPELVSIIDNLIR